VFSGIPIPLSALQRPVPMLQPGEPVGTPVPTMPVLPLAGPTIPRAGEDYGPDAEGAAQASDGEQNVALDDKALDGVR
jgi:hypothetical protein